MDTNILFGFDFLPLIKKCLDNNSCKEFFVRLFLKLHFNLYLNMVYLTLLGCLSYQYIRRLFLCHFYSSILLLSE